MVAYTMRHLSLGKAGDLNYSKWNSCSAYQLQENGVQLETILKSFAETENDQLY